MVSMVWSCFLSIIFNYDTKGIGFIFRRLVCFYRVVSSEFYIACLTFSITFRYCILIDEPGELHVLSVLNPFLQA